jgi:flagellar biosynthesis/type III secretory pathway M-ring protein FliF/YscJ
MSDENKPSEEEQKERPIWTKTWVLYAILNLVILFTAIMAAFIAVKNGLIPGF